MDEYGAKITQKGALNNVLHKKGPPEIAGCIKSVEFRGKTQVCGTRKILDTC